MSNIRFTDQEVKQMNRIIKGHKAIGTWVPMNTHISATTNRLFSHKGAEEYLKGILAELPAGSRIEVAAQAVLKKVQAKQLNMRRGKRNTEERELRQDIADESTLNPLKENVHRRKANHEVNIHRIDEKKETRKTNIKVSENVNRLRHKLTTRGFTPAQQNDVIRAFGISVEAGKEMYAKIKDQRLKALDRAETTATRVHKQAEATATQTFDQAFETVDQTHEHTMETTQRIHTHTEQTAQQTQDHSIETQQVAQDMATQPDKIFLSQQRGIHNRNEHQLDAATITTTAQNWHIMSTAERERFYQMVGGLTQPEIGKVIAYFQKTGVTLNEQLLSTEGFTQTASGILVPERSI